MCVLPRSRWAVRPRRGASFPPPLQVRELCEFPGSDQKNVVGSSRPVRQLRLVFTAATSSQSQQTCAKVSWWASSAVLPPPGGGHADCEEGLSLQ